MPTVILEYNGSDRCALTLDPSLPETHLFELVQKEAERLEVPVSDITLRFAEDDSRASSTEPAKS